MSRTKGFATTTDAGGSALGDGELLPRNTNQSAPPATTAAAPIQSPLFLLSGGLISGCSRKMDAAVSLRASSASAGVTVSRDRALTVVMVSTCRQTAVNRNASARHKRRLVGCEEHDKIADLAWLADAPERNHTLDHVLHVLVSADYAIKHRSLDMPWCARVHANTERSPLEGSALCDPLHCELCGNVNRTAAAEALVTVHRADVDDGALPLRL